MIRNAALLLVLLLAGCFGRGASEDVSPLSPQPRDTVAPNMETVAAEKSGGYYTNKTTGHYTADVMGIFGDPSQPQNDVYILVPENATTLVAELRWTGEQSDFDIQVQTPMYCRDTDTPLVDDVECEARFVTQQEGDGVIIVSRPEGAVGPGSLRAEFGHDDFERERCVGSDECAWRILAVPDLAVDSDFDLRVTLFMEQLPPDGFTAFTE